MMQGVCAILAGFIFLGHGDGKLQQMSSDGAGLKRWHWVCEHNGRKRCLDVMTAGQIGNVEKIVYIFHGYKPEGDPYDQDPARFIEAWDLVSFSQEKNIIFVLPDFADSVYPLAQKDDPLSDLAMAVSLHRHLVSLCKRDVPVISVGFSAGVEGAVKFAYLAGCRRIVCISGNYDLREIPESEKRFHLKVFGSDPTRIFAESPLSILGRMNETELYLFCEENNTVNNMQARILLSQTPPGVRIKDLRSYGKGHKHNWKFLRDPALVKQLHQVVETP